MKNNPLLPHELPDDRDLQHEGLPSLADTVPLDMTSGARIQDSASAIEPRSQRLHVYNDGEVVIDLVIFYKEWGDGKKCLVTFEPIGRVQKGGAPITRERFLLEKPVPPDLLSHIRGHIGGFDGEAGEAFLHESIQNTLDYYQRNIKAWEALTDQQRAASWAALPKNFDRTKLPKGTHLWALKPGLTEEEKRVASAKIERLEAAYEAFIDSPEFRRACADYHGEERDRVVKALPVYQSLARAMDEAAPYFIATNLSEWER